MMPRAPCPTGTEPRAFPATSHSHSVFDASPRHRARRAPARPSRGARVQRRRHAFVRRGGRHREGCLPGAAEAVPRAPGRDQGPRGARRRRPRRHQGVRGAAQGHHGEGTRANRPSSRRSRRAGSRRNRAPERVAATVPIAAGAGLFVTTGQQPRVFFPRPRRGREGADRVAGDPRGPPRRVRERGHEPTARRARRTRAARPYVRARAAPPRGSDRDRDAPNRHRRVRAVDP